MDNAAPLAGSVSVAYLQGLVESLDQVGVAPADLLGHVQLTPAILTQREAGLSFSQLLDETPQQLVLHYLRDPALELADIAFLVGFSEPGSLGRAFRRWTGQNLGD